MNGATDSTRTAGREPTKSAAWTATDIPDLRGRVAVVTGASSGVGYEIAKAMAARGAYVVLASRDPARTEEAAERIRAAAPAASVEAQALDLGSFASIRRFAARL